jgi:hypothetical protein
MGNFLGCIANCSLLITGGLHSAYFGNDDISLFLFQHLFDAHVVIVCLDISNVGTPIDKFD